MTANRALHDDDLSARFRDALKWSEMLIVAKGGKVRRPRELDDEGRAKAQARLAELLAEKVEGVA